MDLSGEGVLRRIVYVELYGQVFMCIFFPRVSAASRRGLGPIKWCNLVPGYPNWAHKDVYFHKIWFPNLRASRIHPEEVLTSSL